MARTDTVSWSAGVNTIVRVTRMAMATPWLATFSVLATVVASALMIWVPLLLGQAIDFAQQTLTGEAGAARRGLAVTAAMVLAVSILRGIFTTFQNYLAEAVGHHLAYRLRQRTYDKIQRLSFGFHDRIHSGELITLGMLDLEAVRMFFATGLIRLVMLLILIGFGAVMLLMTDPLLALVALSFVPVVGVVSSFSQLRLRRTWLELQERLGVLSRVMEENLAGVRVVRAFAAQHHEMNKFRGASVDALGLAHERVRLRVGAAAIMTLSFMTAMGLVLWVGGRQVLAGEMTLGTLATFLTFMTILQMPVRQLGMLVNAFARTSTCGSRLFGLLDLEPAVQDPPGAPALVLGEGRLRFDDVGFAYPSAPDQPVLSRISFEARRGETIGIVGPQGSGKSTIAQLVPRFYDVTEGRITIDGQDMRDVTLASLRKAVTVVQQDAFVFTTTLENNIAYGDPWADPRRIEAASSDAQIHGFIASLPEGYRTVLAERGASLSGGQRQRLSIARGLMLSPPILIFDDSTAAIDARTEEQILAALRQKAQDRLTILIAHRLNTLRHADRIFVLERGRIVEEGSPGALLASDSRYRSLHELQTRAHEGAA
ncbi:MULTISPECIES: ABC transporter ATP-binding protein [unclassified Roseitalea]|uniref:ABC transporter ATP-binding protein n=1 Tax=unclassified Roseitalea TaxID=2639107 RepID=UPI00273D3D9B|nr:MULTISPECIES: ABC transporter ATP-binding protein [unclassified Roseitalea]